MNRCWCNEDSLWLLLVLLLTSTSFQSDYVWYYLNHNNNDTFCEELFTLLLVNLYFLFLYFAFHFLSFDFCIFATVSVSVVINFQNLFSINIQLIQILITFITFIHYCMSVFCCLFYSPKINKVWLFLCSKFQFYILSFYSYFTSTIISDHLNIVFIYFEIIFSLFFWFQFFNLS